MKKEPRKYQYNVVAIYEHMGHLKNEAISKHTTYELAERALRRGPMPTFRGIREIDGDRAA